MFCPNCGTQNPETASTCTKCGFALKSAAPKFKGTMLMQGAPPNMQALRDATAGGAPAAGAAPAPAPGGPSAAVGAGAGNVPPSRLKGTIVGVAAPAAGAAPAPPTATGAGAAPAGGGGFPGTLAFDAPPPVGGQAPPSFDGGLGAPATNEQQHQFGSSSSANPLGATFAIGAESPSPFGHTPGSDANAPNNGGFGGPPAGGGFGGPPADAGGFGGPPAGGGFGAPGADAGGYGGAPAGGGFGAPPADGGMGGGGGYGGPPADAGMGGGYGAPPGAPAPYGAPPGGAPQPDYGQQQQGGYGAPGGGLGGGAPMQPYGGGQMMGGMPGQMMPGAAGDQRPFMITLILAIVAGWAGVHRFYTGHYLLGALQLITGGGCGIWQLVDIIFILTGKFKDAQGRPLLK